MKSVRLHGVVNTKLKVALEWTTSFIKGQCLSRFICKQKISANHIYKVSMFGQRVMSWLIVWWIGCDMCKSDMCKFHNIDWNLFLDIYMPKNGSLVLLLVLQYFSRSDFLTSLMIIL